MKYALSLHLHLGALVTYPVVIDSQHPMAPQPETAHGPETAQHPSYHANLHQTEPLCIYFSPCQLDMGCTKNDRAPLFCSSNILQFHNVYSHLLPQFGSISFFTCHFPQPFC